MRCYYRRSFWPRLHGCFQREALPLNSVTVPVVLRRVYGSVSDALCSSDSQRSPSFFLTNHTQVLWGIATATISQRAVDEDDSASAQALHAVWGEKGHSMVEAVALRAVQISDSLRCQEVSNVLWACAVLRCRCRACSPRFHLWLTLFPGSAPSTFSSGHAPSQ